jgi:hypothetical protein
VAGSLDGSLVYPHKVGLASHIRNANFGEVCVPTPLERLEAASSNISHTRGKRPYDAATSCRSCIRLLPVREARVARR